MATTEDDRTQVEQGSFEGMEVIYRSSKLKATELTGVLALSELKPMTKVRFQGEAVVVDVDHKSVKNVVGVMERIHILEAIPESTVIVEEL